MARRKSMTAAEAAALGIKSKPAKMAPMGNATLENRVKQLERENKALWEAHSLLQCDINKLKGDTNG